MHIHKSIVSARKVRTYCIEILFNTSKSRKVTVERNCKMNDRLKHLISRYPELENCSEEIEVATQKIINCYKSGSKVMICGNGGSAADSTHIVGELMKGFLKRRPVTGALAEQLKNSGKNVDDTLLKNLQCGLPAVNLCESSALLTAYCNDVDPDYIFAQQVFGLGKPNDVLIGISTSGNSKNVNHATRIANAMGIFVVGMTGNSGGKLSENSDVCIKVPANETYKIQEFHLPVYHAICAAVEDAFFDC